MLKTSGSTKSKTQPGEGGVGFGGRRAGYGGSKLDGSEFDGIEVDSIEVEDNEVGKKVQKRSKSKNLSKSTLDFLTSGTKLVFSKLK